MWWLLFTTSILWLSAFLPVSFENNTAGYILIGGIIFIVVTTLVTIITFNEPTQLELNDVSQSWNLVRSKLSMEE